MSEIHIACPSLWSPDLGLWIAGCSCGWEARDNDGICWPLPLSAAMTDSERHVARKTAIFSAMASKAFVNGVELNVSGPIKVDVSREYEDRILRESSFSRFSAYQITGITS